MWEIYTIAALGPAVFLMYLIYKQDKIEKEPRKLLGKLILGGCLSAIPAMILEIVGEVIVSCFFAEGSLGYSIADAFLVVAVAEEGSKFFFLKKFSWKNPAFNYRFDGIVYAVFTGLGFAALENVFYVFENGLGVAVTRGLLSIPGHLAFAVFMGYFYGRARLWLNYGKKENCKSNLRAGFLTAAFLHGLYDSCLFIDSTLSLIIFFAVVVLIDIVVIRLVKLESKTDAPIT